MALARTAYDGSGFVPLTRPHWRTAHDSVCGAGTLMVTSAHPRWVDYRRDGRGLCTAPDVVGADGTLLVLRWETAYHLVKLQPLAQRTRVPRSIACPQRGRLRPISGRLQTGGRKTSVSYSAPRPRQLRAVEAMVSQA